MTDLVAALPMYDWPERRAEVDAQWAAIRDRLRGAGIAAPEHLARRNADLPPVRGGIRDAAGHIIAPDPATLPPDELDLAVLWRHPGLVFAQSCWGPLENSGLAPHVFVLGQPSYDAFPGGKGADYRSAIVMRRYSPPSVASGDISPTRGEISGSALGGLPEAAAANTGSEPRLQTSRDGGALISPLVGEMPGRAEGGAGIALDVEPPLGNHAKLPLDAMRVARFAFNSADSMSGILALGRDLAKMAVIDSPGDLASFFSALVETGSHRATIRAIAEGRADVAAIDCRTWAMAQAHEPAARHLAAVGWTVRRKGLPFVAAKGLAIRVSMVLRDFSGLS